MAKTKKWGLLDWMTWQADVALRAHVAPHYTGYGHHAMQKWCLHGTLIGDY